MVLRRRPPGIMVPDTTLRIPTGIRILIPTRIIGVAFIPTGVPEW